MLNTFFFFFVRTFLSMLNIIVNRYFECCNSYDILITIIHIQTFGIKAIYQKYIDSKYKYKLLLANIKRRFIF